LFLENSAKQLKMQNKAKSDLKTGRVEAFSDGVLAIVITLLVLELKTLHLHDALSRGEALEALRLLLPKFASFLLSFAYVAVFWVNHHRFFDLVARVDTGLVWLNNLFLLFLCFVPFPTEFIGEYPANPVALALFAVVLMSAGFSFTLMWHYAYKQKLLNPSVQKKTAKDAVRRGVFGPLLYVVAAAGAFVTPWIAWIIFSAVPVFFFFHSMQEHSVDA